MDNSIISALIGVGGLVIGALLGRMYQKRKDSLKARANMLKPVEEWIEQVSRLISIVNDEQVAITQGLISPTMYGAEDRVNTAKALGENKEKVMGILDAKVFNTWGTKKVSKKFMKLIPDLSRVIETSYLQIYYRLLDKVEKRGDIGIEIVEMISVTVLVRGYIQEAHKFLAKLKAGLN
jgi:hypothetical protein